MKILHVGLCVDGKNEGLPFALKEASKEYVEFNPGDDNLFFRIENLTFKPDIIFCQLQSDKIQNRPTSELIDLLKRFDSFIVLWNGDKRHGTPIWHFSCNANLFLFSNNEDIINCRNKGLKADFLQIGIDPKVYNKWDSTEPGSDIVYMGNNYRNQFPESPARVTMTQYLKNHFGDRFKLYGNGWERSDGENNPNQALQSKIYNNSKIGINFSQFNSDRYTSDRMFRILGSGCFCLSHNYKGIEKDFKIGEHLDVFNDLTELKDKINYYLSNEKERKEIAENGYKYCHENFSYKSMIENLIKLYHQYKLI